MSTTLHTRMERVTGLIFGAYVAPDISPYRRWPLFVGPIGSGPLNYQRTWQGYRRSWQGAHGFEVSVFGHAIYVARDFGPG